MADRLARALIVLGISAVLSYFLSRWNFIFFHFSVEIFSIVMAASIYVITQFFWKDIQNTYLKMWGISCVWTAVIDFFHMLSYEGLHILAFSDGNSATQLWLAARTFQAFTFFIPIFLRLKNPNKNIINGMSAIVIFLFISSIQWWRIFPVCYIEGTGITVLKIIAEYVLAGMYLISAVLILYKDLGFIRRYKINLSISAIAMAITEISTTILFSFDGITTLIGHFFKIVAFYFLYLTVFDSGVERPLQYLVDTLKSRQEKLHTTEIEYRELFMNLNDGYSTNLVNLDWNGDLLNIILIEVNDAYCEIIGAKRENLVGKTYREFNPAFFKQEQELMEIFHHAALSQEPRTVEKFIPIFEKWLEIKIFSPKRFYFTTILTDVTEKKRREEETLKNQRIESISLLAGGIAHDFNNILMGMLGSLELMKLSSEMDEDYYDSLGEFERATGRAKKLTNQLLTFSKGGAPVKKLENIAEIIRESATFVSRGSNVNIMYDFPTQVPSVEVDAGQIHQVFHNIILNGMQAMPKGGSIILSLEYAESTEELHIPLTKGRYVKIKIRDQGRGIPMELQDQIFNPYFTTKKEGNGLGLTTAFSIIKRHSGYLTFTSVPDMGTTFTIYLPSSDKIIKEFAQPDKNEPPIIERILVMDDDIMIQRILNKICKKIGLVPTIVANGDDCIREYKDNFDTPAAFDCVIMDLTIPGGKGGKETISELLQFDPNINAIVSSGYSNNLLISNYREFGFQGVLIKPYSLENFREVLRKSIRD